MHHFRMILVKDRVTCNMRLSTDNVRNAFKPSSDLYGFSETGPSKRMPARPAFALPVDISTTEDPVEIARFKCNCRYRWLREIHGVSALMMSNSVEEKVFWVLIILGCGFVSVINTDFILAGYVSHRSSTRITFVPVQSIKYPTLVFCPKNADALNYSRIYDDLLVNIGFFNNVTAADVLRYAIAGSGFDNFDVSAWSNEYRCELRELYNTWRANRTILEMFDFLFSENGYLCQEFFESCQAGSRILDCCSIFKPTYVMLRGRCFRLVDDYNQTDVDENDKLLIRFHAVQGSLAAKKKNKAQVIMYIGDSNPEIGLYPRCLPACERVENHKQMITSQDYSGNMNYSFRIETSFTDLQYEHYSEIRMTTALGFISELGGQSGLFVGCSILSVVQVIVSVVIFCVAFSLRIYKTYFSLLLSVKTNNS
ncbi:hypothetical protein ANCCAN_03857 [Ancylostoma caninum]|uniref:Amiloride-sensitive sodium channel n=1 Tax=Ancylostoma caninum TaxID=29170 RepID=A0A368H2P1_ANCCA|nr:hypothetical protein ANCCAN_03857 [Ancylostoma caninum]